LIALIGSFSGYLLAAFNDGGRGLHDLLCGTRVVRK
jgi:uncharacterized RDD family membrane protein YckC